MAEFSKVIAAFPGDPRIGRTARGDEVRIVLRSADADGSLGIFEGWAGPGEGPDWHIHTRETEVFHVVEGTFRFWCGEDEFEGGPGTTVTLPPHVPHQWKNSGTTTGRMLTFIAPGGFEEHFIEIASMAEVTDEAMAALDAKYGIIDGRGGPS